MHRVAVYVFAALWLPLAGLSLGGEGTSSRRDTAAPEPRAVRFNRDIRPILADNCLHCHGADGQARQADLRLDDPNDALRDRDGVRVLLPGNAEGSELYRRITSGDESLRMPPADQHAQLRPAEINLIRRWIEQGATYEKHWAFIAPERPATPKASGADCVRNPIDTFVRSELERHGLEPAPEADRTALIRRVTLDLTGLPPGLDEVESFVADMSPDAYEKVVDRLLSSPQFGERLALMWLDVARYADSGGYQGDIPRTMWPWRDWLIAAINANMPFDQFTIEQLAGDLLPDATHAQKLATGFHRNHRINDEDGIVLEEFRIEYVVDRVETTATAWLGLTMGCARCHDHKYDPLSQKEFYRFAAYFNSIAESGRGHANAPPLLYLDRTIEPQLAEIDRRLAELTAAAEGENAKAQSLKRRRGQLTAGAVTTMVMQDLPRSRDTFVLVRGAYDKPGEKVTHGMPAVLPPLAADAAPNRLALAQWLVDSRNPLTARVTVNRFWQMLFGAGLVRTQEDFGTRGDLPSHPELLDWLATEFVRTGWDVKGLLRQIVTSATYRQSSGVSRERYLQDPDNRWLSRGPRFRLPAELIRDQALFAAGLLDQRIGGPSVKPYQPAGLWEEMVSVETTYKQSHGADLYRRGIYSYIRRTVPAPAMTTLDAPNREICLARRARTNTPLQALVLMNDPTYVEAARVLAERILRDGGSEPAARIDSAFRRVLARPPRAEERKLLEEAVQFSLSRFRAAPERAAQLIGVGEFPVDPALDPVELAAYTSLMSLILNLDEALSKE